MRIQEVVAYPLRIPRPSDQFAGAAGVVRPAELGPAVSAPARSRYSRIGSYPVLFPDAVETCLVRITTDDGIYGWGEAQAPIVPEVVGVLVQRLLGPVLIGSDPFDIEVLWQEMFDTTRVRGHGAGFLLQAMSAIDIALWDILGKSAGRPVCQMAGGRFRDRVEVYQSGLPASTLEGRAALAREAVAAGFRGIKLFLGHAPHSDVDNVRAVCEAVGPDVKVMVDGHWMYDRRTALAVGREYERLGVTWLEAPLDPSDIRGHAELAHDLDMPVALGEVEQTRTQVLELLELHAADIVQPDVGRAGGITEMRRIAALAETFGTPIAPHQGLGVGPVIAAGVHVAASIPNFLVLEYQSLMHSMSREMLVEPIVLRDGFLEVPNGPGLGIDVRMDFVRQYLDWGSDPTGSEGPAPGSGSSWAP